MTQTASTLTDNLQNTDMWLGLAKAAAFPAGALALAVAWVFIAAVVVPWVRERR